MGSPLGIEHKNTIKWLLNWAGKNKKAQEPTNHTKKH
jgi:hypothetical protein